MIQDDYGVEARLQDPNQAVAKGAAIYAQNQSAFNDFILQEAQRTGKSVDQIKEDNKFTGELDKKFTQATGSGGLTITNVLSCTYGVSYRDSATQKSMISNMLKINDPLPAKNVQTFYTNSDHQGGAAIRLFETRSTEDAIEMEDREPLTVIDMTFARPVPKGTPVEITLALDNSGILHVMAVERETDSKLDTTFELSHQMSESELAVAGRRVKGANVE
jgi:molecular chaperone DnaK (HSP70)